MIMQGLWFIFYKVCKKDIYLFYLFWIKRRYEWKQRGFLWKNVTLIRNAFERLKIQMPASKQSSYLISEKLRTKKVSRNSSVAVAIKALAI